AAQSIAQSHSQLAHPAQALEWAQRAYDRMALLQADGDLRQLDWLIAMNAISVGETARARRLLERYLAAEVDRRGFDFVDYYAIGHAGMAEIALAEGDLAQSVRLYDDAIDVFAEESASSRMSLSPWRTMMGAARLVARLRVHATEPALVDWAGTDAAAADLRIRTLVTSR